MKLTAFAKIAAATGCWMLLSTASQIAAAQDGDAQAGEYAFATCSGCHAVPGYTNAYPTYHVPRLGGQNFDYIISALQAYRDDTRNHQTMHANAANLTDQDMINIAAYLGQFKDVAGDVGPVRNDPAAGEALAATCTACHGPAGNVPILPSYPRLAGQYEDYLLKALHDYKAQMRTSPTAAMMMPMVTSLSDDDLANLAAYFASQESGLAVVDFTGGE